LRTTFKLTLKCADARTAKTLEAVLAPDNRPLPRGLRFAEKRTGRSLAFEASSQNHRSAHAAVESVLSDARLFQEVWLLSRRGAA
jgi:Transcription factor Pcc1